MTFMTCETHVPTMIRDGVMRWRNAKPSFDGLTVKLRFDF